MSLASCIFGVPSDATYRAIQGLADDTVMRLLAQGNHDALAVIFDRYQRIVYRIALQILRDPGEAEDVMQSVFIAILQTADKFVADRGTLRVWILQHAYHLALNRRRYLNLRGAYAHSDTIDSPAPAESYAGMTRVDSRRLVQQGLAQLSRQQRETLELAFYEGLTMQEIADRTGQSYANVRHHYYRGLDKLRLVLSPVESGRQPTCGNGEESAYAQS